MLKEQYKKEVRRIQQIIRRAGDKGYTWTKEPFQFPHITRITAKVIEELHEVKPITIYKMMNLNGRPATEAEHERRVEAGKKSYQTRVNNTRLKTFYHEMEIYVKIKDIREKANKSYDCEYNHLAIMKDNTCYDVILPSNGQMNDFYIKAYKEKYKGYEMYFYDDKLLEQYGEIL